MVLVWLFAVFSSAVNACVLAGPPQSGVHAGLAVGLDAEGDQAGHHPAALHDLMADGAEHAVAATHSDDGDDHASCTRFCEDQKATLTKHASQDSPELPAALLDTGGTPVVYPPAAPAHRRVSPAPRALGPPVALRFLRLTL
jgi:hypothetical protein